jgi:nucleoside-diphosphate-sugar epimerase
LDKVVVTGANGFVGRSVLSHFLALEVPVLPWSRSPFSHDEVLYQGRGEITAQSLEALYKEENFGYIVHCAARIQGTPGTLKDANERLVDEIVKFLENHSDVYFIFISSVSAIEKLGPYGQSKRNCELLVENSNVKKWTILRPSLVYGKGDNKNVADLIRVSRLLPIVPIPGGRNVKLQPLYIEDMNYVLLRLIKESSYYGRHFIISGPKQEYLWDMVGEIQNALGKKKLRVSFPIAILKHGINLIQTIIPFLNLPKQQVNTLHDHQPWSNFEIEKEIGFVGTPFSEGIRKTLN